MRCVLQAMLGARRSLGRLLFVDVGYAARMCVFHRRVDRLSASIGRDRKPLPVRSLHALPCMYDPSSDNGISLQGRRLKPGIYECTFLTPALECLGVRLRLSASPPTVSPRKRFVLSPPIVFFYVSLVLIFQAPRSCSGGARGVEGGRGGSGEAVRHNLLRQQVQLLGAAEGSLLLGVRICREISTTFFTGQLAGANSAVVGAQPASYTGYDRSKHMASSMDGITCPRCQTCNRLMEPVERGWNKRAREKCHAPLHRL